MAIGSLPRSDTSAKITLWPPGVILPSEMRYASFALLRSVMMAEGWSRPSGSSLCVMSAFLSMRASIKSPTAQLDHVLVDAGFVGRFELPGIAAPDEDQRFAGRLQALDFEALDGFLQLGDLVPPRGVLVQRLQDEVVGLTAGAEGEHKQKRDQQHRHGAEQQVGGAEIHEMTLTIVSISRRRTASGCGEIRHDQLAFPCSR